MITTPPTSVHQSPRSGRPLLRVARAVGRPPQQLTLACLRLASPHASLNAWRERLELLCHGYGEREIRARMQDLQHNGFITEGLPTIGYLTDKGRDMLRRFA